MNTDLNAIRENICKKLNIEALNPMQEAAIEKGLSGESLMILSPTGSGKTIAFLTLILNQLSTTKEGVTSLVVVPSRELALQIETVFKTLQTSFKVTCCYGGHSVKIEEQTLVEAPALIVGTPGRIADHLLRGTVNLSKVDVVVLDEFDKLLQMGFEPEMEKIFDAFRNKPQVILTSATWLDNVPGFLRMGKYGTVDYRVEEESRLKLNLVRSSDADKSKVLIELARYFNQEPAIVFLTQREDVLRLSLILEKEDIAHGIFHGAMEQIDREKSLIKFRSGAHNLLIATDLAARGLDIPEIKHIVHFQCPTRESEFVHRNGRTARMHADGNAYFILLEDENLPSYLENEEVNNLKIKPNSSQKSYPNYSCIYISAGKKDKISKGDILGFLTQNCGLQGEEIGLITVLDKTSFVAIKREKVRELLKQLNSPRIKKIKVKIALAS